MLIIAFVIIQTVVFGIVILVLRRLLYKDTMSAVNRLKLVDEENAKRLEEMKQKIKEAEEEYRQKKAETAEDTRKQREEAKAELEKEKDRILAHAKTESEGIVGGAQRKAERIDRAMGKELEEKALVLSGKILKSVLSENIRAELHEKMADELIRAIDSLDAGRIPPEATEAEVASSHPLTGEQKIRIQDLLEKKMGKKITVTEKVEETLIGGLSIRMGSLMMDGSVENKLKESLRELKKGMK